MLGITCTTTLWGAFEETEAQTGEVMGLVPSHNLYMEEFWAQISLLLAVCLVHYEHVFILEGTLERILPSLDQVSFAEH